MTLHIGSAASDYFLTSCPYLAIRQRPTFEQLPTIRRWTVCSSSYVTRKVAFLLITPGSRLSLVS